jgi:ribose transport system ATP-binding protein/rhamnose transport system ATP-binding protein
MTSTSAGLEAAVASKPIRLTVERICKSFGDVAALSEVSLSVREGEIHAICGENGSGKSTFVKILTGLYLPEAGSITINQSPVRFTQPQDAEAQGIAVVAQELSLCPDLTVLDNIWLGSRQVPLFHKRASLVRKAQEALSSLGVTDIRLDQRVSELEIGQRQLVEIARMLARDAELLILDEPTATLSDRDIDRLFTALSALRNAGRSIIYITHRLAEVFRLCDTVTVFRNGKLIETRPTTSFDRNSLIESMLGRPLVNMYPAHPHHDGDVALAIGNLSIPGILNNFNLTVRRNAITCLVGQAGSGAVDIIKAISGLIYDASGSILVNGRTLPLGSPMASLDAGIMYITWSRHA